jgi:hypothetical protein
MCLQFECSAAMIVNCGCYQSLRKPERQARRRIEPFDGSLGDLPLASLSPARLLNFVFQDSDFTLHSTSFEGRYPTSKPWSPSGPL